MKEILTMYVYILYKHEKEMDKRLRYKLLQVEGRIKEFCPAGDDFDQYRFVMNSSGKDKEKLRSLLMERRNLLDRMLLWTPAEIARMKEVNDRLYNLTKILHEKTYSLYKTLLQTGYDPGFDDDIMIEGRLTYVVDDWEDGESVLSMAEDEEYGSDFKWMMGLIYSLSDIKELYACARTFTSYDINDRPDMTAKELGLDDDFDDGQSWDHGHHSALNDICICHAVYNLTDINLFSYPDVLRMNDYWCEVRVTHQLLTDLKGERYSCILNRGKK